MKTVKLSDELVNVLIAEASTRIADNMRGPNPEDPREILAKYRKLRKANKVGHDYDPDADFLDALLAAEKEAPARNEIGIDNSSVITLPPRIAAVLAWEATQRNRTPEQQALLALAEYHKENVVCFGDEYRQVWWLTEGSSAEPFAKADWEDFERRMEAREQGEEVAS